MATPSSERPNEKVTLRQIAEKAGVSIAAVSMALNNKKGVSKERADDLRRIARDMGYLSDTPIRGNKQSINLIQPIKHQEHRNDLFGTLVSEFLQALTVEAGKADFGLEIHVRESEDMHEVAALINDSNRIGSVILGAGLDQEDVEILARVESPIVFVEGFARGVHADFVSQDNETVVHDLLLYLIGKGYQEIGLVQDETYSHNLDLREKAFHRYVEQAGLPFTSEWLFRIPSADGGTDAMRRLLESRGSRPRALLCVNDIIALRTIRACEDLGVPVPGELAIVGFDDLPVSRLIRPQLTTARVSRALLARRCMELLRDRIQMGPEKAPEHISIGGIVIPRESA